jgi:kumamolisin
VTPALYARSGRGGFRDVRSGDNDVSGGAIVAYRAGPGWDACTGLGVPDGEALARLLDET